MNCLDCKRKLNLHKKMNVTYLKKGEKIRCYTCGIMIEKEGEEYKTCTNCNEFKSCKECRLCNNGHYLERVFYLNQLNTGYMSGYGCDNCGSNFNYFGDLGVWHCPSCHYDLCPTCVP